MENLIPIIDELDKLKIPHMDYRSNGVVWCPAPIAIAQTKYNKIMYIDFIKGSNKVWIGYYSQNDNWSGHIDDRQATPHEALAEMVNFYYNEIEGIE